MEGARLRRSANTRVKGHIKMKAMAGGMMDYAAFKKRKQNIQSKLR